MCESSNFVSRTQEAKRGQTYRLRQVPGAGSHVGLYPLKGGLMACVKGKVRAVLSEVLLKRHSPFYAEYNGKKNVEVEFSGAFHSGNFDTIKFPDGTVEYFMNFRPGSTIKLLAPKKAKKPAAKKITGKKGVAIVKKAIDEAVRLIERPRRAKAKTRRSVRA